MKPISGKRMDRVLTRKGWKFLRSTGAHRTYLGPDGVTLVTVPYHTKDLKPGTQRSIMKDAGLTDADL
jgi:predicted RNA binding protein YcfA (HicA-like mRNA interferase family)